MPSVFVYKRFRHAFTNRHQPSAYMKCPDCGELLEPDAQFCPKCFARIEPPGFWRRLFSSLIGRSKSRRPLVTIQKTISIKTKDKDGQEHEYHSLDAVPADFREEIQKLEAETLKETLKHSSSDGLTTFSSKKTLSVFRVKDASGNERVYHSLDELPPEIKKAIEQAQKQTPD